MSVAGTADASSLIDRVRAIEPTLRAYAADAERERSPNGWMPAVGAVYDRALILESRKYARS